MDNNYNNLQNQNPANINNTPQMDQFGFFPQGQASNVPLEQNYQMPNNVVQEQNVINNWNQPQTNTNMAPVNEVPNNMMAANQAVNYGWEQAQTNIAPVNEISNNMIQDPNAMNNWGQTTTNIPNNMVALNQTTVSSWGPADTPVPEVQNNMTATQTAVNGWEPAQTNMAPVNKEPNKAILTPDQVFGNPNAMPNGEEEKKEEPKPSAPTSIVVNPELDAPGADSATSDARLATLNINGEYNNLNKSIYAKNQVVEPNAQNQTVAPKKTISIKLTKDKKTFLILVAVIFVFILIMPVIFDLIQNIKSR